MIKNMGSGATLPNGIPGLSLTICVILGVSVSLPLQWNYNSTSLKGLWRNLDVIQVRHLELCLHMARVQQKLVFRLQMYDCLNLYLNFISSQNEA